MLARLKPHTIVGMFVVLDGHGGRECAELVFKRLGYHVLVRAPHLRQHICLSFELTPINSIALCNPTFAYASFLPNIHARQAALHSSSLAAGTTGKSSEQTMGFG